LDSSESSISSFSNTSDSSESSISNTHKRSLDSSELSELNNRKRKTSSKNMIESKKRVPITKKKLEKSGSSDDLYKKITENKKAPYKMKVFDFKKLYSSCKKENPRTKDLKKHKRRRSVPVVRYGQYNPNDKFSLVFISINK